MHSYHVTCQSQSNIGRENQLSTQLMLAGRRCQVSIVSQNCFAKDNLHSANLASTTIDIITVKY